jgi:hypothetical protein
MAFGVTIVPGKTLAVRAVMFPAVNSSLAVNSCQFGQWLLESSGFATFGFGFMPGLEYSILLAFGAFVFRIVAGRRAALWAAVASRWLVCGWAPWVKVWVLDVGGLGKL